MRILSLLFIVFLAISSWADNCNIGFDIKEQMMKMDFQVFDQSEHGWRAIALKGCALEARDLIDSYVHQNNNLNQSQIRILTWHSGQLSAFLDQTTEAISRFEKSYNPEEDMKGRFLWNSYIDATIAFMKKEMITLKLARQALAKGESPYNHRNLRIVDSFIRCFSSSYKEAYSNTCKPEETNIDRIRSKAIEIKESNKIPAGVSEYLATKKLILVGEIHGNEESPKIFSQIVNSFIGNNNKVLVALEIPSMSQEDINSFLKTGNEEYLRKNFFFTQRDQDGRSSKAMVELLRSLSRMPGIEVLCMDGDSFDAQSRDTLMAKNISEKIKSGFDHVLVYSGNVHSSIVVGTPWDNTFRPMGYELNKLLGFSDQSVLNIRLRYETLNSWICMGNDNLCKAYSGHSVRTDYSEAVPWKSYFMEEDEFVDGHNATLFIRKTTVSNPYIFSGVR